MIKNLELQSYQLFKDKYDGKWNKNFLKDLIRLKTGEPLDYIIGWVPFLNCKIDLRIKPLIPRPETEYWTEKLISLIRANGGIRKKLKIIDIFSGSGCIGIAILKNIPHSQVHFAEIDPKLIKQIKLSLKINKISPKRYKLIESNAFINIKEKYDFILANPPYIPLKNKHKVQKLVLKHEPQLALFGGKDGMKYIKQVFEYASKFLNPTGQLWLEFDSSQKNAITKLLKNNKSFTNLKFHKDQYNRWRFIVATI